MARGSNPFQLADADKRKLANGTKKKIIKLYQQVADNLDNKIGSINLNNPSGNTKKYYTEFMKQEVYKSMDKLEKELEAEITTSAKNSGKLAVNAQNSVMSKAGLVLEGAYGYVPEKVVENLVSGSLYKGNWKLSQSIWKNTRKIKSDVQKVIAKGLAENKSIKDISEDLVKYLNPSARKPWDWSKVYPGVTTKVDYNAQRLARTMVQHAYQQSLIQSMKYNPFCSGIIWHSVFAHGRTCEMCKERDGITYPLAKLPLDHPNGLCYFEPSLQPMSDIADDLADWVNGKPNKGIDEYVAHAFL